MKNLLNVSALISILVLVGCSADNSETRDKAIVDKQQSIYQDTQPVHIYDYSIPRDIYQQIYDITTTKAVATYSVIESVTGVTRYECPSIGYPIPADVSLTNPLQGINQVDNMGTDKYEVVVEQAEPNGLFASKNTDATWVLCVSLKDGIAYPVYSEHKAMTFPFIMEIAENGQWVRADNKPILFKVNITDSKEKKRPPVVQ